MGSIQGKKDTIDATKYTVANRRKTYEPTTLYLDDKRARKSMKRKSKILCGIFLGSLSDNAEKGIEARGWDWVISLF
jgi:hypothetical protein